MECAAEKPAANPAASGVTVRRASPSALTAVGVVDTGGSVTSVGGEVGGVAGPVISLLGIGPSASPAEHPPAANTAVTTRARWHRRITPPSLASAPDLSGSSREIREPHAACRGRWLTSIDGP